VSGDGAERRPVALSSSAHGWTGDLLLAGRRFEIKAHTRGVEALYRWLEGRFGLIVAADCEEPLIVLRLGDFLRAYRFRAPAEPPGSKPSKRVSSARQKPTERS